MSSSATSSGKSGFLKKLAIFAGAFFVLALVGYHYLTSAGFFRGTILPKVSRAIGAEVTVTDVELHPFSSVTLKGLKIQTPGLAPVATIEEVRARYHLFSILGGKFQFDEISVQSPVVQELTSADGKSNLDPILRAQKPPSASASSGSSATLPRRDSST